ncbi:GlsB/YeaQ/YmgE family stress response membrane protein [candidate division KSB1 bacterium]|nr:GlsB/YeaQ/YmgE family stress response membrane protein [candidate division KSB1 bacterium]
MSFLVLLIIAAICGSIGASIAGRSSSGCLSSIVLGFIGALIGSWLSRELAVPDWFVFHRIPIVWSIIGAALFVAALGILNPSHSKKRR